MIDDELDRSMTRLRLFDLVEKQTFTLHLHVLTSAAHLFLHYSIHPTEARDSLTKQQTVAN